MIYYIISLTLLTAVAILIRTVFKKAVAPRYLYAVWLVVIVRMIMPFPLFRVTVPETVQPIENIFESGEQHSEEFQNEEISTVVELYPDESISSTPLQTPLNDFSEAIHSTYVEYEGTEKTTDEAEQSVVPPDAIPDKKPSGINFTIVEQTTTEEAQLSWTTVVNTVWGVGAAVILLWFALSTVIFSCNLRRDRKLFTTAGKTKVYISSGAGAPCVSGIIPTVYITPEAAEKPDVHYIIEHEKTHIAHLDPVWSVIRILAVSVFWYNPVIWLAAFLSKQDSELAADDSIAARLDDSSRYEYANTIIGTIPEKHRYATGFGSAPIKERIIMLTKKRKTSIVALILALALTFSAVGCAFIGTKPAEDAPEEPDQVNSIPEETKTVLLNTVTTKKTPNRSHKYVDEYDEYGRIIKSTAYTDGEEFSVTEYTYDEYGYQNSEKFVSDEMSYIYEWTNDTDGNRLKGTEKTEQANGLSSFESEYEYTYDEKGRVLSYVETTRAKLPMTAGETVTEQHRSYEYTDEYGSHIMKEWGDDIPETVYLFQFDENGNIDEETVFMDGEETNWTKFDRHGNAMTARRKTTSGMEVTRFDNTYENGLLTKIVKKDDNHNIISTTVITYDENGNLLTTVTTDGDGNETSNTVYEYEEFEVKVFVNYSSPIDKAEADAMYDAFIKDCIIEDRNKIRTQEFRDLDFNGVDEYLVYVISGYDWMCEIFTIEDGEVKAFTPYSVSVKDGITVPMAKNALLIPLYSRPAKLISTLRSFCVGSDGKTGEKVTVLLSEIINNTHAYAELFVFSSSDGRLKAASEGKYQWSRGIDGTGDVIYYINGKSVNEDSYTEMARSLLRTVCEKYGIDTLTEFAGLHPMKRSNLDGFSYNPSKRTVRFGDSEPLTLGENDALLILNGSVAPLDAIYTDENGKYHIKVSTMEEYGVMTSLTPDKDGFILWDDYESGENPDHYYPRNGEHSCGVSDGVEDIHSLFYQMRTVRITDHMYTCGKEESCVELLRWYLTAEYEKKYGVDYAPLATLPEKSDYQTYERYMITNLALNRTIGRFVEVTAHEIYYVDLYSHDIFLLHDGAEQSFELVFSQEDEYSMPAIIDSDGYGNISVKVLSGNTHSFVKSKRYIAAPRSQSAESSDAVQLAAIYDNVAGEYLTDYVFVLGDYGIQGVSTKENGEAEYLIGKQIGEYGTEKLSIYKTDPFEILYDGNGIKLPTYVYDGDRIIFYDGLRGQSHDFVSSDGKQLHTDAAYNSLDLLPDGNFVLCTENSFTVYDMGFKVVHESKKYDYVLYDAQANYLYVRTDGKMMLTDAYETYQRPYEDEQHVLDTSYPFLETNQFMDIIVRFFHDEYSKGDELKGNALYATALLCINAAQQEKPTFSIVGNDKEHYVEIKKSDIDHIAGMILGNEVDLTEYHGTLGKKPEVSDPKFNYLIDEYFPDESVYHFIIGRDYWNDDPCAIDHDTVVIEENSSTLVYSARIDIYEEQFSDVVTESKYLNYTFKKVCDNELKYLRLVSIEDTASCKIVSERAPDYSDGMAAVESDVYPFPDDSTKSLGIMWLHKRVLVEAVATVRDNSTGEVSDWYRISSTNKPDSTRKVTGWVPVSCVEKYNENASVPDNALYQIKMGAEYTRDGVTETFDKDSMNVTMGLCQTEENGSMKFITYGGSTVVVKSKDCVEENDRLIPPAWANVP